MNEIFFILSDSCLIVTFWSQHIDTLSREHYTTKKR